MATWSCGWTAPAADSPRPLLRSSYVTLLKNTVSFRTGDPPQNETIPATRACSAEYSGSDGYAELPSAKMDGGFSSYASISSRLDPDGTNRLLKNTLQYRPRFWFSSRANVQTDQVGAHPDEESIPIGYEGVYQQFCEPQAWSPVFAYSGDFTFRMAAVYQRNGELHYCFALLCNTVRRMEDRTVRLSRKKSYVMFVTKTEQELTKFTEEMTLLYVGHRLVDNLPRQPSRISSRSQAYINDHGEAVLTFLTYVLRINEHGFNRLVTVSEPVASNSIVRDFLDLSKPQPQPVFATAKSCIARLERPDARPMLPSGWFGVDGSEPFISRSPIRRTSAADIPSTFKADDNWIDVLSQVSRSRPSTRSMRPLFPNKCSRYVPPRLWPADRFNEGAFTVEITSAAVQNGIVRYVISVLYYAEGGLETIKVEHRYSEFDALASLLETKVPNLSVHRYLPSKTFFRCTDARYVERRASQLQRFLERVLGLQFRGILDQDIPLIAQPDTRDFLGLPQVEWSLVPRGKDAPSSRSRDYPTFMSPRHTDLSPAFFSHTPVADTFGIYSESLTPTLHPLNGRKRGDSV